MPDFGALSDRAWRVRQLYAEFEARAHGRAWTAEEVALGFMGDVGDLAKLIQAAEGVRSIPDARAKLAHELADCLWSLMTLARLYEVDLEASFAGLMNELEASLTQRLASEGGGSPIPPARSPPPARRRPG